MQPQVENLQGQRRHQSIVQSFHALIRQGQLEHGAKLPSERDLAEQLKVGRSSVREAIRSLELQGLVVTKHGSGTFINTRNLDAMTTLMASTVSSETDVLQEIFEMRHLLEPQIAALAAHRATSEEVEHLASILREQQRQIMEGETGVDADTQFHFALASTTHNNALVKVVNAVEDVLRQSRGQSFEQPGRPERSLESHIQILEMVRSRNETGARQAMDRHLTTVEPAS